MSNPAESAHQGSALPVPVAGTTTREEFGSTSLAAQAETASTAVAAQAAAQVQARYVMALKRPRDLDTVRHLLLKECKRPGFAEVARYRKPIGQGIEGPSIRFAEAAIRCMTNILPETVTTYDDVSKRILRVSVTDLETNVTYSKDITIDKTVERNSLRSGQTALRTRVNSYGKNVFIVRAEDDDMLNKENALVSKALRTCALRLLPGDIMDEAMDLVIATLRDKAAKDPDSERKKMIDAFGSLGVTPAMLKDYVGRELTTLSPSEIVDLRSLYQTIKDGEATWTEAVANKGGTVEAVASPNGKPSNAAELTAKLKQEKAKKAEAKPAPGVCEVCHTTGGHQPGCPDSDDQGEG